MLEIVINGKKSCLSDHSHLLDLVRERGIENKRIAIEHNGSIVPRDAWKTTRLFEGDQLEIVVAVGGG